MHLYVCLCLCVCIKYTPYSHPFDVQKCGLHMLRQQHNITTSQHRYNITITQSVAEAAEEQQQLYHQRRRSLITIVLLVHMRCISHSSASSDNYCIVDAVCVLVRANISLAMCLCEYCQSMIIHREMLLDAVRHIISNDRCRKPECQMLFAADSTYTVHVSFHRIYRNATTTATTSTTSTLTTTICAGDNNIVSGYVCGIHDVLSSSSSQSSSSVECHTWNV